MDNKILLIYYSRTGYTKKIMNYLSEKTKSDIEEIKEDKDRSGIIEYIKSGYESLTKKKPEIHELKNDPADYEMVVIGSPVWASRMASPVRTFMTKYKNDINKAIFITCQKGTVNGKAFDDMEETLEKKEIKSLGLREEHVDNDIHKVMIDDLLCEIKYS